MELLTRAWRLASRADSAPRVGLLLRVSADVTGSEERAYQNATTAIQQLTSVEEWLGKLEPLVIVTSRF